jgi:methylase of polypeptide subunit release factors
VSGLDIGHADTSTRTTSFGPLTIRYDHRVLEPREWTAQQSTWAGELLAIAPEGPVLELCAGVGHIGLLAIAASSRPLVLVDLNPVACEFARQNIATAGMAHQVEVREGRMDEVVRPDERFALVIADPPWVPSADTGRFPDDPLVAIDGGEDGLGLAHTCVALMGAHLVEGGNGLLQLGTPEQAAAVEEHLAKHPGLGLRLVELRQYGDRGVVARLLRLPA